MQESGKCRIYPGIIISIKWLLLPTGDEVHALYDRSALLPIFEIEIKIGIEIEMEPIVIGIFCWYWIGIAIRVGIPPRFYVNTRLNPNPNPNSNSNPNTTFMKFWRTRQAKPLISQPLTCSLDFDLKAR